MPEDMAAGLSALIADAARVITAPAVVERLSKDFYWYSPVLKKQLQAKKGDIAVQPVSVDEVLAIARYAGEHGIPLTVRGAGTGNYGQCIPLHGGIVMDLALMDKLEEISRYQHHQVDGGKPRHARDSSGRKYVGKRA